MNLDRWPKRTARRYDCGTRGMLTVREIARIAGVEPNSIWGRINADWTGDRLCEPRCIKPSRSRTSHRDDEHAPPQAAAIYLGIQVARKYGNRVPDASELQDSFNLSRATAYRWRAAIAAAIGGHP